MSQAAAVRGRLDGLAAAFRFARIPFVCAAIVALVTADPTGRTLAIALGVVFVGFGIALNARQIFLGQPAPQSVQSPASIEVRRAA